MLVIEPDTLRCCKGPAAGGEALSNRRTREGRAGRDGIVVHSLQNLHVARVSAPAADPYKLEPKIIVFETCIFKMINFFNDFKNQTGTIISGSGAAPRQVAKIDPEKYD